MENRNKFDKGEKVKIISYHNTKRRFGINNYMKNLVNNIITIDIVDDYDYSCIVDTSGYNWDIKDIQKLEPVAPIYPEPEMFNTEHLFIGEI